MLLSSDQISELFAATIALNLTNQREALLSEVNRSFRAQLPQTSAPNAQLLLDLNRMNETAELTDGSVPLVQWLTQAVLLSTGNPQQAAYQRALTALQSRPVGKPSGERGERGGGGWGGGGGGAHNPSPRRPHFLDESPLDFSRPETHALQSLLEENIYNRPDIIHLFERAGILKGRILLEQPPRALWHDVLSAAAAQGRTRRLVEVIAADPEWSTLRSRLEDLLGDKPSGEAGPSKVDWKARAKTTGNERLLGAKATWVDVHFLQRGLDCAKSVVRLTAWFGDASLLGTGFFIAPGVVLTNHHVLFDPHTGAAADRIEVLVDFEILPDGSIRSPKPITVAMPVIRSDATLDWACFEVSDPALKDRPALSLGSKTPVARGDFVNIIQHPHGLPKKLGIFRNEVRYVDASIMQYSTDTESGSSGSPVLNARWEVVALHCRWTVAEQPDGLQEIRNEGVVIDRVIEALRTKGVLPTLAPRASRSS